MIDLSNWNARPLPSQIVLEGRYCRIEPLSLRHADQLFAASMAPGYEERFLYLTTGPQNRPQFDAWLAAMINQLDMQFSAVIDLSSGRCEGRQALMRIEPAHGVIELGNILWGPSISRSRITTEAFYLVAQYVFDQLQYRRFEWKCDALNQPSRSAALRFGFSFEGIFQQHMIIKGKNRDTCWFAMLDHQWPRIKSAYEAWLQPSNFDAQGKQLRKLQSLL